MIVISKIKSTVKIVPAINTVLISECCHSYCGKYILARFGNKRNLKCKKSCGKVMQNKIILEV